mgnify:CR=1 FL=1
MKRVMTTRLERILQQEKLASQKQKRRRLIIFLIGFLVLTFLIISAITHFNRDDLKSENYFVDSKHQNIKSRFDKTSSKKIQSIVELPVTQNDQINQVVAKVVKEWQQSFFDIIKDKNQADFVATQNVSYQVYLNDDQFLSMAVFVKQDYQGAHPVSRTFFWTFEKKTGRLLKLSDLLKQGRDSKEFFAKVVKLIQTEILKNNNTSGDEAEIVRALQDDFSFVVRDKQTLELPFGQGVVGPESAGEINLALKVDDFKDDLQTELARQIFAIEDLSLPKAPKVTKNPGKVLALTFDDGPGRYTMDLLATLDRYQAKATFFVLGGQVKKYPEVLKAVASKGHQIGSHSFNHPDLTKISDAQVEQEISQTDSAIKNVLPDYKVSILRPPYGAYNQETSQIAKKHGLANVLWSVDTRDWADRDSAIVCNRAVSGAKSGSIILLHDIHSTSVAAVPCILEKLTKSGYKFLTVSELFQSNLEPGATYFGSY